MFTNEDDESEDEALLAGAPPLSTIRVRAKRGGIYQLIERKPGEVFELILDGMFNPELALNSPRIEVLGPWPEGIARRNPSQKPAPAAPRAPARPPS